MAVAPLLNWLLVFKLGFGLDGAAAATVLCYTVETLLLLGVVFVRDRRLAGTELQTWHGWCAPLDSASIALVNCAGLSGVEQLSLLLAASDHTYRHCI